MEFNLFRQNFSYMSSSGGNKEESCCSSLTNLSILIILSGSEELNCGFSSFVLNDPNENAAFLPFGSGTRACVGQKFVIQVVATFLASLLKKYEVRRANHCFYSCYLY